MKLMAALLMFVSSATAAQWYAATNGSGNTGTIGSPMGLSNAMSATSPVAGGDTLWVRGGIYTGCFVCSLSAPSNNPIIVRNYNGERATIDSQGDGLSGNTPTLDVEGSGTWIWGLEITDSNTNRLVTRGDGIDFNLVNPGNGNKAINNIIHDNTDGIFISYQSTNTEICGNVIFNNGYQGTNGDRGHGHGIYGKNYPANPQPYQVFRENVSLDQFGEGLQAFSTSTDAFAIGFTILGNICFLNGSCAQAGGLVHYPNIIIGDYNNPSDKITIATNFTYHTDLASDNQCFELGYQANGVGLTNGTILCLSNVIVGGNQCLFFWTNVTYISNILVDARNGQEIFTFGGEQARVIDYNTYYRAGAGADPVDLNNTGISIATWQGLGFDMNGGFTNSLPNGIWTYVRQNPYDITRANIAIYNWNTNDNVSVSLAGIVPNGGIYHIYNAQNYFASAVASGTYSGGLVSLPMTNLGVAAPVGPVPSPPESGPTFNAFVLLSQIGNANVITVGSAMLNNFHAQ